MKRLGEEALVLDSCVYFTERGLKCPQNGVVYLTVEMIHVLKVLLQQFDHMDFQTEQRGTGLPLLSIFHHFCSRGPHIYKIKLFQDQYQRGDPIGAEKHASTQINGPAH